jgi:hypothetical protein
VPENSNWAANAALLQQRQTIRMPQYREPALQVFYGEYSQKHGISPTSLLGLEKYTGEYI